MPGASDTVASIAMHDRPIVGPSKEKPGSGGSRAVTEGVVAASVRKFNAPVCSGVARAGAGAAAGQGSVCRPVPGAGFSAATRRAQGTMTFGKAAVVAQAVCSGRLFCDCHHGHFPFLFFAPSPVYQQGPCQLVNCFKFNNLWHDASVTARSKCPISDRLCAEPDRKPR